jgi:hypothetical protein
LVVEINIIMEMANAEFCYKEVILVCKKIEIIFYFYYNKAKYKKIQ